VTAPLQLLADGQRVLLGTGEVPWRELMDDQRDAHAANSLLPHEIACQP
jgi:hypothetical protein